MQQVGAIPLGLRLYRGLATLAGAAGWPYLYWRLRRRGYGASFRPRLGLALPTVPAPDGQPRLWLHGVSVGEIAAAAPLVRELRARLPAAQLFFSTGTETGQAVARRAYSQYGPVFYYPVDVPWSVRRVLDQVQPSLYVALETEIWPNFLLAAKTRGVRLALVNGRLSARSFRNYLKIKDQLFYILNLFSLIATSSPEDHQRFADLGAEPHRLILTGNTKFDRWPDAATLAQVEVFRRCLQLRGEPIFLTASTHPGEEEVLLQAYLKLRQTSPTLLWLLAPRHPERAGALGKLLEAAGLPWQLWHELKEGRPRQTSVVVIDTVGDLFALYGLADLIFVGGSLVPHGGQNILEPAVWGKVPLYGPHLDNFRAAQSLLEAVQAGWPITDAPSLVAAVRHCLDHPQDLERRGAAGQAALQPHRGAAQRQADLLAALLSSAKPSV
ncbi:MAG: 3-deoxy-D-manno-octulosonic acid transferase [Desulfobacca sp.]|uniref:3-deoxy-D-manno-octulosonic acid transferase n=1 Tax=Desulfobacca sp. TaxID=2067990 RepID=UPI004049501E